MKGPITTSLFSLFKAGPGPSSSHTMGPMRAGCLFREACAALPRELAARAASVQARLYGSLSATGAGHGTDAAILAGLLGWTPEECPPGMLRKLASAPEEKHFMDLGGKRVETGLSRMVHDDVHHAHPWSNTLELELLDSGGNALFSREYYSTGGGFVQWKGWQEPETGMPAHPYSCMDELRAIARNEGLNIHEILLDNETAITGAHRKDVIHRLNMLLDAMEESVRRGLDAGGVLPGPLGVQRKARLLWETAGKRLSSPERFLTALKACAFAAAEENADGGVVVTAPTCGSAGVLPALLYAMRHEMFIGDRAIREGFLSAAAIGFIARHNASIAGAEVGCQGEIGVASAMGAAMLTDALGYSSHIVENAAEVALEHHLGMTCDPVGGYVQIPCIERCAMGAVKAFNASLISRGTDSGAHRVSLDAAIAAMAETGREMSRKFKETSLGGLAVSMVEC